MTQFFSVSILIPIINETFSMEETVSTILKTCAQEDLKEIIALVAEKTTPESLAVCRRLQETCPIPFEIHKQRRAFVGGAIQEGFLIAKGSHVIMMASDLETDPVLVPELIEKAKQNPSAVITATRWRGGQFRGYNPLKLACNFVFQKFFSIVYGVRLTDMTFGYRLFPSTLVKRIRWEETRHPFFLETLIKPVRLAVPIVEIPVSWMARREGSSQNSFWRNFAYFKTGLRVRFSSIGTWLREAPR